MKVPSFFSIIPLKRIPFLRVTYFILQNNFIMCILIRNKTHQFTIAHLSVQKDIISAYLHQFACYQSSCHFSRTTRSSHCLIL